MSPSALRRRALLSGTVLAAAAVGYGRRAYGQCAPTVAPNYQCSGANLTTQTINANNASVSTVAGFSVTAAAGNAITITGDGALSYTDINISPLRAPLYLLAPAAIFSPRPAASPSTPMARSAAATALLRATPARAR